MRTCPITAIRPHPARDLDQMNALMMGRSAIFVGAQAYTEAWRQHHPRPSPPRIAARFLKTRALDRLCRREVETDRRRGLSRPRVSGTAVIPPGSAGPSFRSGIFRG